MGRFGVLEDLMKKTNLLARNSIRRWENDEELGTSPLMPKVRCSPYCLIETCQTESIH